jgi:hypothetical protein
MATAVMLVGLAFAPLCACLCDSPASAGKAHDHAHHEGHGESEPAGDHACEHDCTHLTATLPAQLPSFSLSSNVHLQSVGATAIGSIGAPPSDARGAVEAHHPDRGPPVPPPLRSILRL